jgi:hypothetical protein
MRTVRAAVLQSGGAVEPNHKLGIVKLHGCAPRRPSNPASPKWWSPDGNRNFEKPQITTLLQCYRHTRKALHKLKHFVVCSRCAYAIPPGPALNVVSVAWRAGGSPGAPEALLAGRRLALASRRLAWHAAPEARPGQLCLSKQPAIARFPTKANQNPPITDEGVPRTNPPRAILVSDPCEGVSLSSPAPLLRNSFAGPANADCPTCTPQR